MTSSKNSPGNMESDKHTLPHRTTHAETNIESSSGQTSTQTNWTPISSIHPSAQDLTLLRALQNFVVPFVQLNETIEAQSRTVPDLTQLPLVPAAGKLLAALQEFVATIVQSSQSNQVNFQSQAPGQRIVEVDMKDPDVVPIAAPSLDTLRVTDKEHDISGARQHDLPPLEKVIAKLRYLVFNTMPIRLLSFQERKSKFQITLVGRSAVYAQLESQLRSEFDERQFYLDWSKEIEEEPYISEEHTEAAFVKEYASKYCQYAILSHTWLREGPGEITFSDWQNGVLNVREPGYRKLANFCKTALKDYGFNLGWMDTICIDKESSTELDESIRSMYKWYLNATCCIVYLAETDNISTMHSDTWFTRGWTLQELIAPNRIKFYNARWQKLVDSPETDKTHGEIIKQINKATTITPKDLKEVAGFIPISRKMKWAAKRDVTREEDAAYSLMGLFDVSISIAYGEGIERALFRLIKEILDSNPNARDIFNWAGYSPRSRSFLLPTKLQNYLHCSSDPEVYYGESGSLAPLLLTPRGIQMQVLLLPAQLTRTPHLSYEPCGDFSCTIQFQLCNREEPVFYNLLERQRTLGTQDNLTFAVLNIGSEKAETVLIPRTCLAIALQFSSLTSPDLYFDRVHSREPIVFKLSKLSRFVSCNLVNYLETRYYKVEKKQLIYHGMRLDTLYL